MVNLPYFNPKYSIHFLSCDHAASLILLASFLLRTRFLTFNQNTTSKSGNTNVEEQKDLASKPVVDAKAIYGEPPAADEESASERENEAATKTEEA